MSRQPPDRDHDWLGIVDCAAMLGITLSAVTQRCRRGTMPFTEHDGQRWFRRDLIETWRLARLAQREQGSGNVQLPHTDWP